MRWATYLYAMAGLLALNMPAAAAAAAPAFRHILYVIQENRTPDNLFGSNPHFEPGVDIAVTGTNSAGTVIQFGPVALNGCYDISHKHAAFEDGYAGAWDQEPLSRPVPPCRIPENPQYKYVDNSRGEINPYFDLAKSYGFANRMFQTNQGPSFPAHMFLFAGTSAIAPAAHILVAENPAAKTASGQPIMQSGCIAPSAQRVALINPAGSETAVHGIYPCVDFPSLPDLLQAQVPKLSWQYYATSPSSIWTSPSAVRHICQATGPATARVCGGPEWTRNVHANNPARVLTDIAGCRLAAVTWVTPDAQFSDHAAINKGGGPSWVASIVNAIGGQHCTDGESYWNDTVIFVTWDDWGGWVDHVRPFAVPQPPHFGAGYIYGFRVPLLVISAYTKPGTVSNGTYDFGSLLYFAEQNFHLGFIGDLARPPVRYADFYAAARGAMPEFFTRATPRPFVKLAAPHDAAYFTALAPSAEGPDDD